MRISLDTVQILADNGDENAKAIALWCEKSVEPHVVSNDTQLGVWELDWINNSDEQKTA